MNIWHNVTKDSMGRLNAKEELQGVLAQLSMRGHKLICADITVDHDGWEQEMDRIHLKVVRTPQETEAFFKRLDFKYNPGYGTQMISGTVWLTNGAWLTRGEYDGSEWWEVHREPMIPDHLRTKPHYEEDGQY
jgi:hypothetical protein